MARILIIDDNEFFRSMLNATLVSLGHEVTDAADGKEGLEQYTFQRFDLVITDLIMPGVEGIETILELRRRSLGIRIIAMSGGGRVSAESYLDIAQRVGARQVLPKPFTNAELVAAIDAALA